jgi:lysophospholipase L1-like esterase
LIAARWQSETQARLPQEQQCGLIFSFGTNDAAIALGHGIRVELEKSIALTKKILIDAKSWLPTLMIGPIPVIDAMQPFNSGAGIFEFNNARIAHYNNSYKELADQLDVPYLDVFNTLKSNSIWAASQTMNDGIHPQHDGYKLLANYIQSWAAFQQFIGS